MSELDTDSVYVGFGRMLENELTAHISDTDVHTKVNVVQSQLIHSSNAILIKIKQTNFDFAVLSTEALL